tara:strand:+ start:1473 stop:1676 length:204 start_codon:yes stop_codon:yes gene_type:complete
VKQKTAYALRKQVQLKNSVKKLKEIERQDKDVSPKKKKNLIKKMRVLKKWFERETHKTKRKRQTKVS